MPSSYRSLLAAQRRAERDAVKRLRELEKLRREADKQSELDAARLEVESHEMRLAVLQSMHRDCMEEVDWAALAARAGQRGQAENR